MPQGGGDGIEQRRLASSDRPAQRFAKLGAVAGERMIGREAGPDAFVEIDSEDLVRRITAGGKRQTGGHHRFAPGEHAAAVVDHQTGGNGRVFVLEESDRLRAAVLVHRERVTRQPLDESRPSISDADVQDDQFGP